MSPGGTRHKIVFLLFLLGTFAALQQGFARSAASFDSGHPAATILVTSALDAGPGSLRAALFDAARSDTRARIRLRVPSIRLTTPLPAVFNPRGVEIESEGAPVVLDATALREGPALEVQAPDSVLRRIRILGAAGAGILCRSRGLVVEHLEISESGDGLVAVDGSDGLVVRRSRFSKNEVGIRILAASPQLEIHDNHFEAHTRAAIWAVRGSAPEAPDPNALSIHHNTSIRDRVGIVLGHTAARIVENEIAESTDTAVLLLDARARLERNRIRNSAGIGVFVDVSSGSVIRDNEVDHNQVAGVLVRSASNVELRMNEVHSNGFGIISVFDGKAAPLVVANNLVLGNTEDGLVVIGGAPRIERNRSFGNRKAGLRIVDFVRQDGARESAAPRIEANTFRDNGFDDPVREEWFEADTR